MTTPLTEDLMTYEDLIGHLSVAASFRKADLSPRNNDSETMMEAAKALRALIDEVKVLRGAVELMASKVTLAEIVLQSTKPIKDLAKVVEAISRA